MMIKEISENALKNLINWNHRISEWKVESIFEIHLPDYKKIEFFNIRRFVIFKTNLIFLYNNLHRLRLLFKKNNILMQNCFFQYCPETQKKFQYNNFYVSNLIMKVFDIFIKKLHILIFFLKKSSNNMITKTSVNCFKL